MGTKDPVASHKEDMMVREKMLHREMLNQEMLNQEMLFQEMGWAEMETEIKVPLSLRDVNPSRLNSRKE